MSLRLAPELSERLQECAKKLRMGKHTLAQDAIEAVVEAVEKNGYKLVLPIEFEVTHVAVEKTSSSSRYPLKPDEGHILNEGGKKKTA